MGSSEHTACLSSPFCLGSFSSVPCDEWHLIFLESKVRELKTRHCHSSACLANVSRRADVTNSDHLMKTLVTLPSSGS